MSMEEKLAARNEARQIISAGGGTDKQSKVKSSGKLLAGERMTALFDEGKKNVCSCRN